MCADDRYEPPEVEELPAEDGPAVTAAGFTGPEDGEGPEWRPADDEQRVEEQADEP
jgi:hypothetical protein